MSAGDSTQAEDRSAGPFRIAFVPGVTPDKWSRTWRQREPRIPLELLPVSEADQLTVLYDGRADMCFVRLPVDGGGLHVIPLYRETPVVVVPTEHVVTVLDEVSVADLAEQSLVDVSQVTAEQAIGLVASGAGIVIVPQSVARLHRRKDLTYRPVTDGPESQIGLAWSADTADPRVERFIGIVRGRTARSSRDTEPTTTPTSRKKQQPEEPGERSPTAKPTGHRRAGARRRGRGRS